MATAQRFEMEVQPNTGVTEKSKPLDEQQGEAATAVEGVEKDPKAEAEQQFAEALDQLEAALANAESMRLNSVQIATIRQQMVYYRGNETVSNQVLPRVFGSENDEIREAEIRKWLLELVISLNIRLYQNTERKPVPGEGEDSASCRTLKYQLLDAQDVFDIALLNYRSVSGS